MGEILYGKMILNDAGRMVEKWYFELENKYTHVKCGEMIIMPNHFHCIVGANLRVCPSTGTPLPQIVQWFKTMTTNEYIRGVKSKGWQPFDGKLWQRNYWEHIIRNERSYNNIVNYIRSNPMKWDADNINPIND
ncbi:transposase [Membranihabitans marinus]